MKIDTIGEKRLVFALALTLLISLMIFTTVKPDQEFWKELLMDLLAGCILTSIFLAGYIVIRRR